MTHNGAPTIWFGLVLMAAIYAPAVGFVITLWRHKED